MSSARSESPPGDSFATSTSRPTSSIGPREAGFGPGGRVYPGISLGRRTWSGAHAGRVPSSERSAFRNPVTDHLLTPQNAALVVIDFQPSQVQTVASMDQGVLV